MLKSSSDAHANKACKPLPTVKFHIASIALAWKNVRSPQDRFTSDLPCTVQNGVQGAQYAVSPVGHDTGKNGKLPARNSEYVAKKTMNPCATTNAPIIATFRHENFR